MKGTAFLKTGLLKTGAPNRAIRYLQLIIVFCFVLLIIDSYFPVYKNAWSLNLGLVIIQKGLMASCPEQVADGQEILSQSDFSSGYFNGLIQARINPNNLLANHGFEFIGHGWSLGDTAQVTSGVSHQGYRSLEITFKDTNDTFYHVYQDVEVKPDSCYRLSAYARIEGNVDGIAIELWDAERGFRHWYGGKSDLLNGPVEWTLISIDFCTERDIEKAQVRLRRYPQNNASATGVVWFDDFLLEPIPSP